MNFKILTLLGILFLIVSVSFVAASERDETIRQADGFERDYNRILGEVQSSEAHDSELYQQAIGLASTALANKRYSNGRAEIGKEDEALEYAKLYLHGIYGASYAIYLSKVSYYRNKSLGLNASYQSAWSPPFDLINELKDAEENYDKAITYFNYVLSRDFGQNTTQLSSELRNRYEYETYLSKSFVAYKEVSEELEKRILTNKKLEERNASATERNNFFQLFIAFVLGAIAVYVYFYFKTRRVSIEADIEDLDDIDFPKSVDLRLTETLNVMKDYHPVASMIMMGATLEAMLKYGYNWAHGRDQSDNMWGIKEFVGAIKRIYLIDGNIITQIERVRSTRNDAVHNSYSSFDIELVKSRFADLKAILKYFMEKKDAIKREGEIKRRTP